MESRAPSLAVQIRDLNLPNCPVRSGQCFVGRLSVSPEKRLLGRLGWALRGARLRYLPADQGVLKPGEACAVLSGDARAPHPGQLTWNSEGVSTMLPILPLEASEILVVDSISGNNTRAWKSVSLEPYFPCPCSSCPGRSEAELFLKNKCPGLLSVTSE